MAVTSLGPDLKPVLGVEVIGSGATDMSGLCLMVFLVRSF